MNNLLYGINDKPPIGKWCIYALQQMMAVFVATVLIANICGTPISSCLFGACIGTIIYQLFTKGQSPMFISSCGATVSSVIGALAMATTGQNYLAVAIGGLVIFAVYAIVALVVKLKGIEAINKVFPPALVGTITIVIGVNLAGFIGTYVLVNGEHSNIGILVAIATMIIVAVTSHYGKGFLKSIPFLIGLLGGYALSVVLTLTNAELMVDFTVFNGIDIVALPDFVFLKYADCTLTWGNVGQVILLFLPVALCSLMEHYSDHRVLSNIIGTDLTEKPGLHRTLLGDGCASFVGTVVCGLPNTSYGESIATTGFSRVASTAVITLGAIFLGILSFIEPVQAFIQSIPSAVFGGCAMILYGYIASSGLKTIVNSKVNLEDNKNLIIISVVLTVGVSGIWLFDEAFAGIALAMVLGIILNLILRERKEN